MRVYGELASVRDDPTERAALLELVVLETYVLGELTVALMALGFEPLMGDVEAEADADLAAHRADDWPTLVQWLQRDAEVALGEYLPMRDLTASDPSLSGVARLVVAHEEALISFTQRTLAGQAGALDDVRALIGQDGH